MYQLETEANDEDLAIAPYLSANLNRIARMWGADLVESGVDTNTTGVAAGAVSGVFPEKRATETMDTAGE